MVAMDENMMRQSVIGHMLTLLATTFLQLVCTDRYTGWIHGQGMATSNHTDSECEF